MKKTISITLEEIDWGQIIDGLICRAEQYEQTADYYEGGYVEGEVLEVRDSAEALYLAEWSRRLAEQLRNQLMEAQNEVGRTTVYRISECSRRYARGLLRLHL